MLWQALVELDLAEMAAENDPQPTLRAERLRVWQGRARHVGGKWSDEILPQLSMILRLPIVSDEEAEANSRTRRARSLARELDGRKRRERAAELREEQLSRMTGMQRVLAMIADRTPVLEAQYDEEQWQAERVRQLNIANAMRAEHGTDDSYPDFESELWDRVIFTIDEMTHAAIQFERRGRATPARQEAALV